jgi:hypothetical protein
MASNDDNNTVLGIMKIRLPAAIFATTGHPEIIELLIIIRSCEHLSISMSL